MSMATSSGFYALFLATSGLLLLSLTQSIQKSPQNLGRAAVSSRVPAKLSIFPRHSRRTPSCIRRLDAPRSGGFGSTTDAPQAERKVPQDLALMSTLLPKLGQAKCFGVDPADYVEQPPIESKLASTIENVAKKLEENFAKRGGYGMSEWREVLEGEWQLLFTTSQIYRDNRGVTGYSGLPGYGLKGVYSRIIPDEDNEEIDGKAILIEVLSAPFGKAAKNELRGAYKMYTKNDYMKKKQVVLDQVFTRGDTGGEMGKDLKGNLMMFNTYVTKDGKLRFGRSSKGALYIYGRIGEKGGINEILSRDRLPWDGGSPLFRVF